MSEVRVEDHLFPVRDLVVIEEVKDELSAGGIFIPESARTKKLALKVIAVGDKVTSVKPGDLIMPSDGPASMFKLFGRVFMAINEFQIIAKLSPEAMELDAKYAVFDELRGDENN